ncbi:hypothetical protein GA0070606_1488 [Micromonospora citrea]|uniref:Uncharacterized protein n=1 Tax=Micromonospora citrea TaxID=47855 RepID=A0A1C6U6J1_9ACTN|nr:DUF6220 domain-containing protein [Micromonospora citrea]SCL49548.1 hypothetical protein GA0070606_1488 [Micromonospora citrea]
MRRFFLGLAALQMLAVVAQFFLAASGAFDTAPRDEAFRAHRVLGPAVVLIAVLAVVVAATARMPGRLIGMSGLVAGLAVVQFVIKAIATALDGAGGGTTAGDLVFGLHAVNGLAIVAVTGRILRQARQLSRPAAPTEQAP